MEVEVLTKERPSVTSLVPWFGAARMIAEHVGRSLSGCRWVGIPFAGSMSELVCIEATSIVCNDLHRHVINLARCIQVPRTRAMLLKQLKSLPFHPDVLKNSQAHARGSLRDVEHAKLDPEMAYHYFITQWMGRSGSAGTNSEFSCSLPVRWTASGGDSNTRYRSAVKSLASWGRIVERCNFTVMDAFDFISRIKDQNGLGIYVDPPFPDAGDVYKHKFSAADQEKLASVLESFRDTRIVCRFYGTHPLIEKLYPTDLWTWNWIPGGRKNTNEEAPEVLIVRNA